MNAINQAALDEFVGIARRYCAWAESSAGDPPQEMYQVREFLAELHLAVVRLPETDFDDSERKDAVSHDDWKKVLERFSNLPVVEYWDVFDPLEEKEPLWNSLADDLADIYRDVKRDLLLFDAGHVDEAVWQWRFHFLIHWGQHLTGAQRAIHSYINKYEHEHL
jgi:hypothetical protein